MRKRNHKMPYPEKLKILEELFEGVKCLCEGKIIHRSLHPDSIVVCENKNDRPTFKICGFMDSFDLQQRTPNGNDTPNSTKLSNSGVTDYTAPEIKLFKRHNEKADVWSLGALLYWMLFGQIHGIIVNIEG
jgi:serine/threonine protein kinase